MKKLIKALSLKAIFFSTLILITLHSSSSLALSSNNMVVFTKDGKYSGFSKETKTLIKNSREILQKRQKIFSKKFRQFESIYHAANLMRMIKGNMFLYGPPGGAKSYFLNWLLGYEQKSPFKIQMHQMMTEQVFVGGQDYEAAKRGVFKVTHDGSLSDYETALIDEMDKGNPATLAALLSLLNERKVYLGGETFASPLETIFSTSNKNLHEFYTEFEKNGQGSTADALLNRFSCIAFVPNWLEEEDQAFLDNMYLADLESEFHANSSAENKKDYHLDWERMRALAHALFVPTKEFNLMTRELVNRLRKESINLIKKQENQYNLDIIPYYPTVQYTERLRQKVTEVILMSLALDFLTSPLTEDIDKLEASLKNTENHRFIITPLSLWRAYPILTTVSYGATRLDIQEEDKNTISINFDDFLEKYEGENNRVAQMIEYIKQERDIFKSTLDEIWQEYKEKVQDASSSSAMFTCGNEAAAESQDIEKILFFMSKE